MKIFAILLLFLSACANEKMASINEHINRVPYVAPTDKASVKTPAEFMQKGGNCKDYAEAKYQALLAAGFKDEDLKFILVNFNTEKRENHVVLEVRGHYILDSQTDNLRPASSVYGNRMSHDRWMRILGYMRAA